MTVQELQLELIKLASFNDFHGDNVVRDLLERRELWTGAVMDAESWGRDRGVSLIKLRDIKDNIWNVDTLFIIPVRGKELELLALVACWGADEVGWIGGSEAESLLGSYSPEARDNSMAILRIWWD